ncbi:hypothetical protein JCM3765_005702 [Sporobolomyces pararoseus]
MSWLGSIFGVGTTQEEGPPTSASSGTTPTLSPPPTSIKVGVLLDGDADYFTHAYTSKGYRGGRSAALDLRNKVHHYILSKTPNAVSVEIIAFSFLNLQGLQSYLGSGNDLRGFMQGFNSSPYAFSMSDVGPREQAADEAIKSHLPFLLSTCDLILLGGTHDGGYSQTLLRLDPKNLHEKVLLLRTTSFCAERILELGLKEVRFEGLFEGKDPTTNTNRNKQQHSNTFSRPFSSVTPFQNLVDRLTPTTSPNTTTINIPPVTTTTTTTTSPSISSTTSSSSSTWTPTTSLSSQPIDFSPLIQTLNFYFYSKQIQQPRLKEICHNLKKRHTNALKVGDGGRGREEIGFMEFVREAERRGIVRLGTDWIELIRNYPITTVGSEKGKEKQLDHLTPTSTSFVDFIPLLSILSDYATSTPPIPKPLRAVIGEKLSKSKNPPFPTGQPGQFKNYYEKALSKGLVRIGRGEVLGAEWIELGISLKEAKEIIDRGTTTSTLRREEEEEEKINSTNTQPPPKPDISKFLPLLEVLVSHLPLNPKPEWTPIAGFVATYQPRPYGFEPGSFKRYVQEAEHLRLIETGTVPGKSFNFWMKLKRTKEQVEELIKFEREKQPMNQLLFKSSKFTQMILPTLTTTTIPTITNQTGDVEKIDSKFYPLIKTLQGMRTVKPDWGTVGEILSKNYHPRPYSPQDGGLKKYLLDAQRVGLVETGKFEGREFDYWIKLNPNFQNFQIPISSSSSSQATPVTSTSIKSITIPPKFLPLVQTISESQFTQPYCSQIAATLTNRVVPKPFEVGGWNSYLREAVQRGLVRTGVKGQGQEWVQLREGVVEGAFKKAHQQTSITNTTATTTNFSNVVPPSQTPSPIVSKTHRPTPSFSNSTSSSSSSKLQSSSSATMIPPALLQHWNSLYNSHPFSPLILTLNFIESSTTTTTTSIGSSSFIPIETVGEYLEILPGGIETALNRAGERLVKYQAVEGLERYLNTAHMQGVVEKNKEGIKLMDNFKGWKGR